jgi:hypothetical protein
MSKINPLEQPDPLLGLLQNIQQQFNDLLKSMGSYELRQEILKQELLDIEAQITCLNLLQDCIDELSDRLESRKI